MKKAITSVIIFQALCYASMIAGNFMQNGSIIGAAFVADIVGAVICPMILAVAAMIAALTKEKRVLQMYPSGACTVGGIGLFRGLIFFAVQGAMGFVGAMRYLVISFLILTLWFIIFELSAGMLNKDTKFNRKKK